LARLARGVQDCARALASLADRIDGLEQRLDVVATPSLTHAPSDADADDLAAMVRALEEMSGDRVQALDHRLRRLESVPATVSRLQKDFAWLADLATTRTAQAASTANGADVAHIYKELDSVNEMVAAHHAAASQSLERVRTLERAVLEMRRHLERNLTEHSRAAGSEQAAAGDRVTRLEARLAALEASPPSGG
jgi:uncharacterized coiled-coil protein SlyX